MYIRQTDIQQKKNKMQRNQYVIHQDNQTWTDYSDALDKQ